MSALPTHRLSDERSVAPQLEPASMQAAPQSNKYGLDDREVEIALASVPDRNDYRGGNMSRDDKLRSYVENKQRYARMKQTGEYSNQFDQGRR